MAREISWGKEEGVTGTVDMEDMFVGVVELVVVEVQSRRERERDWIKVNIYRGRNIYEGKERIKKE